MLVQKIIIITYVLSFMFAMMFKMCVPIAFVKHGTVTLTNAMSISHIDLSCHSSQSLSLSANVSTVTQYRLFM